MSLLSGIEEDPVQATEFAKINDEEGSSLKRLCLFPPPASTHEFEEAEMQAAYSQGNLTAMEHSGERCTHDCRARGSRKKSQKRVKVLKHAAHEDAPLGCGNPICVVLERRPMRFSSLCHFNQFTALTGRDKVHFIQKGDCYEIIDGGGRSMELPWVDLYPALQPEDCAQCENDIRCNKKIVFNIGIDSVLNGNSSAYGGINFNNEESNKRLPGIPLEFSNVCEAMVFFQSFRNINLHTQVVGYSLGTKESVYPRDGESCLWTEWFDHDTPCNGKGDMELHMEHQSFLGTSYTGQQRICSEKSIKETQWQGGSEVTTNSAQECIEGEGMGYPFNDQSEKITQDILTTTTSVTCENKKQKLFPPAPFKWAEDLGVKCLDYKQRYCCKSVDMYRPQSLNEFSRFIEASLPIGPTLTRIAWSEGMKQVDKIKFTIKSLYGDKEKKDNCIKMELEGLDIDKVLSNRTKQSFTGRIYNSKDYIVNVVGALYHEKKPNGERTIDVKVFEQRRDKDKNTERKEVVGMIKLLVNVENRVIDTRIEDHGSGGRSVTQHDHNEDLPKEYLEKKEKEKKTDTSGSWDVLPGVCVSNVMPGNGEDQRVKLAAIEESDGGINGDIMERKRTNPGKEKKAAGVKLWSQITALNQAHHFDYMIESPPLATLFAECEWRDWINQDYPNKARTGLEVELRARANQDRTLSKMACGDIPENAHYIDAATVQDRVPWYELKESGRSYETFKLSPFFGYACNDENMPDAKSPYCKDMKIRFCCAKKTRAEWGEWGDWDQCSKSCGGGIQKRSRKCNPTKNPNQLSCFGMNANPEEKRRFLEQKRECNVEWCDVDYRWSHWGPWSSCSTSCGQGRQRKKRICFPPEGGGQRCPEINEENVDLYETHKDCSNDKCESFHPGQWSSWSAISVTCGVGKVTKSRKCLSTTTLKSVENIKCVAAGKWDTEGFFKQEKDYKLKDCPVDGGWTRWQAWGACTQDCVPSPSELEIAKATKAIHKRYKYCSNPIPFGTGKKCPVPEGYKLEGSALVDQKPCIAKDLGGTLPYCKVNCVYSSWSEWSQCSKTCIERRALSFRPPAEDALYQPDLIKITDDEASSGELPVRKRRMCKIKNEKYGGSCPQEIENVGAHYVQKDDAPFIEQTEDCILAKEHCLDPSKNPDYYDQFKWPRVPYPGEDRRAVGYCPLSCAWQPVKVLMDCQNNQDKEYKERKCYMPKIIEHMTSNKEQEHLIEEMNERIRNREVRADADDNDGPKSIKSRMRKHCGRGKKDRRRWRSRGCRKTRKIKRTFKEDLAHIYTLTTKEVSRDAVLPNLDGLFGGDACRTQDGKKLTKYLEKDGDDHFFGAEDYTVSQGECDVQICTANHIPEDGGTDERCISVWSEWKEWGSCNTDCGDQGKRIRKRSCVCACDSSKEMQDCRPAMRTFTNETVLDKDTAPCTPCPPHKSGQWSQWESWTSSGYKCSNTANAKTTYRRQRKCLAGPVEKKCRAGRSGVEEGYDTETMEVPQPPCGLEETAAPTHPTELASSEQLPEYTVIENSQELPLIVV